MALAFDTLAYTKALEAGGVERQHAEVHAQAVRDHVMRDIATKADIEAALERQTLKMTVRLGLLVFSAATLVVAVLALLLP